MGSRFASGNLKQIQLRLKCILVVEKKRKSIKREKTTLADKEQTIIPRGLHEAGTERVWSASFGPTPRCWHRSRSVVENPESRSQCEHPIHRMLHCPHHHNTDGNQTHRNLQVLPSRRLLTEGCWVCMRTVEYHRWLLVTPFRTAETPVCKWIVTTKTALTAG